ncbi:MAG TPA: hypothetical protein VGM62_09750 [Chthoniobacterales bacterium]
MRPLGRRLLFAVEILVLSALILATRCANYPDVFIGDHIYFTDADCYARMTRVRLCAQHPGLILRHHIFENYPQGTTPHTTAPLDYAILFFSYLLRPFSSRPIDMAGALISPVFAIVAGAFLCFWARRMKLAYRWAMLLLFALSPILVHGTELGRPDHQSLAILLVLVGLCADVVALESAEARWSIVSGSAWGLAIWVTAYEPLILLGLSTVAGLAFLRNPQTEAKSASLTVAIADVFRSGRTKWIVCGAILLCALLIERRMLSVSMFVRDPIFRNWSRTIGELGSISFLNPIWLKWLGWLIAAAPFLVLLSMRTRFNRMPVTILFLLVITFGLTMWQARWGYFLALLFVLALPALLKSVPSRLVAWLLFVISLWPILQDWDEKLWPNEFTGARQDERRHEAVELHEMSISLISAQRQPFLAPWWLSPAITYWSGQPGVAGSSHESISGIADSARFFLAQDPSEALDILRRRGVEWVIAYDAGRVQQTSSAILGKAGSDRSLALILDQRPTRAPAFLTLFFQNGTVKIFEVTNKW